MKLHRRTFLRAAGVAMALPLLDALAAERARGPQRLAVPRRMVCINTPLGVHPPYFFPKTAGRDYELSPYLEVLKDFRDDFTVISGLSHPDVGPSHDSNQSFLTAAPHPERRAGFREQHLARSVRGRADLRPDALPHAAAVVRRLRPVLDHERRARADGKLAVERVRQAVSRRPPRRGRRPRPAGWRTGRASSTRSAIRPSSWSRSSARTTAKSSTSTSPASASWSSGWPRPRPGRRSPSPRSMPSRRRTSRTAPTWSARPGSGST